MPPCGGSFICGSPDVSGLGVGLGVGLGIGLGVGADIGLDTGSVGVPGTKPNSSTVVCGTSKTGPSLSVGCPTTLKNISTSSQQSNHTTACAQSSLGSTAYIGPVSSTTDNVLAIKDWVFSDANGSTKLANGYYKAAGANLDGVSAANGSFRVINGIVTEIQAC